MFLDFNKIIYFWKVIAENVFATFSRNQIFNNNKKTFFWKRNFGKYDNASQRRYLILTASSYKQTGLGWSSQPVAHGRHTAIPRPAIRWCLCQRAALWPRPPLSHTRVRESRALEGARWKVGVTQITLAPVSFGITLPTDSLIITVTEYNDNYCHVLSIHLTDQMLTSSQAAFRRPRSTVSHRLYQILQ